MAVSSSTIPALLHFFAGGFRCRVLPGILFGCISLFLVGCGPAREQRAVPAKVNRVISLAPSITETICALGGENQLVAVTDFCDYPPQVCSKQRVGGYLDPNYEMIIALKPDLVILMREHGMVKEFLLKASIPFLEIDNHNVDAILESFRKIGAALGKTRQADSLCNAVTVVCNRPSGYETLRKPRVLVSVERSEMGSGIVSQVYSAGPGTFYDDIIASAGGVNVLAPNSPRYPQIGAEGVLKLNPDIIIDIMTSTGTLDSVTVTRDWQIFNNVSAIRTGSVHCCAGDYVNIPGPRIVKLIADFKEITALWHKTAGD